MDIVGSFNWFVADPLSTRSPWLFVYRLGRLLNDVTRGRFDDLIRWRYSHPIADPQALILDQDGILIKNWPVNYAERDAFCQTLFEAYYGVAPRYRAYHSWTSTPAAQPTEARWHRDNTSAMTLNTFTYLCDVGEQNGPHQYQRGTHRDRLKRFTPSDNLKQPENSEAVVTVCGAAGTTFIDISHGLHRATHAQTGQRITAEVLYSYHAFPDCQKIAKS